MRSAFKARVSTVMSSALCETSSQSSCSHRAQEEFMNGLSRWSIVAMLLTGCASVPPPTPLPEVPAGAPWGLAWIPPSGEVAIRAGAIEHVLYPGASTRKPARTAAAIPSTDAPSSRPRAAGSQPAPLPVPSTWRVPTEPAMRAQCELEQDVVPAWFFSRTASRVPERVAVAKDGCPVPP